ncbi:MAG: restriction endonuclease subunit R, partial [Candidatus Bathyarchaeia archaeon]
MQLIVGATLQKSDVEAIRLGHENSEKILSEMMLRHLDDIYEELIRDHVKALAWLVARDQLEIKVAIVVDEAGYPIDHDTATKTGIFHQKVGILEDADGNIISFSGSINESAMSWENNIEEFKVFR